MQTDPIGDMLVAIKNGYIAGKKSVLIPYSRMKVNLLKILKEEKFIEDSEVAEKGKRNVLMVTLRYENKKPVIEVMHRVSKPGRRVYVDKKKVPWVRNGFGTSILSTDKGIMTDRQARVKGVGGEIICEIW